MKFKLYIFLIGISINYLSYSQQATTNHQNITLSPITEVMIQKHYTPEQIKELSSNTYKLNLMEYDFSKSFEVVTGQTYTQEAFLKFDVLNYRLSRKLDEDVIIYDQASGLNILLYSLNKVERGRHLAEPSYEMRGGKPKKTMNQ